MIVNWHNKGDAETRDATMKSLHIKLALSALGIVAMLASPALAQKSQRATYPNQASSSQTIPGYDSNGQTVAIPDPDQR
jgi:hypothetical protein